MDLHNKKMFGYEVLSELSHTVDCETWFHHQPPGRLLALRQWQLQQIEALPVNGVLFLNLPLTALQLPDITMKMSSEHPHRVIELQDPEMLLTLDGAQRDQLRQGLAALSRLGFPLWLDDYRPCYNDALDTLNWRFDGVKIDRSAFQQHRRAPEALTRLVRDTQKYGTKILVEGVETMKDLSTVLQSPADMAQGFYWPEILIPTAA